LVLDFSINFNFKFQILYIIYYFCYYNIYTMSSEDEKAQALAALIGELNAASELTMEQRMVPGREEGYHAAIESGVVPSHLKYPGEGGKRKRKGAGNAPSGMASPSACNNRYVSLAVDSAIILAGAAAVVGGGYGGLTTLQYYMSVYGIDAATIAVINALYTTLSTTLNGIITTGSAVIGTIGTGLSAAAPVVGTAARGIGTVAGPTIEAVARMTPAMLLGRYLSIGFKAREDAMEILNALNAQYTAITEYAGTVTRSMTAKKAKLEEKISRVSASTRGAYESVRGAANSAAASTAAGYAAIKNAICNFIDRVNSGVSDASDAALAFSGILTGEIGDISGSMGGKYSKRRTRRNKNKGKKSRKEKSRKNKRRSHRRH
jgi:hypothetical protein